MLEARYSSCSRYSHIFLSNFGKEHWNRVKWIFRYIRGTSKFRLGFGNGKLELVGYADADVVGDVDTYKTISDYLITFSGRAISWQSRLQKCIALSNKEAKFIAAIEAYKELLWMKKFLRELGFQQQQYVVFCDNQSAIHLAKKSTFHSRSKHIDVRYRWIRETLNGKLLELGKIHTDYNGSDMLTKVITREKLEICCSISGMVNPSTWSGRGRFVVLGSLLYG